MNVADVCLCGASAARPQTMHGILMLECTCGVLRQHVDMTRPQLREWYEQRYFGDGVYYHSYDHDRKIAAMRLDVYDIPPGAKLLDVGAGNGAFVDECVSQYIDAWGQDIANESNGRTWVGELEGVAFPAHRFGVVTMHDVLEHVPDPKAMLREVARTLQPGGRLIVDFPRFHHEEGVHHWKATEHLWMLTEDELASLIHDCGYRVDRIEHPIPSKVVVYATNEVEPSNVKILVPPGIGDGYWVLSKLRGILGRLGIYLPEVYVHDSGPRRADGLWERVPFVRFAGYGKISSCVEWNRAYKPPGVPVQSDVQGYDLFISFNGTMDGGQSLDEAIQGPLNWHEPLFVPKTHELYRDMYRERFGDYVAVAFYDKGFYERWLADFSPVLILRSLQELAAGGLTVVMMGAHWDEGALSSRLAKADARFVDLIGKTDFGQMMALVDGASAVYGHPAGNTMLGAYLNVPTVLLWGNTFPKSFRVNACPPNADYLPMDVTKATPKDIARALLVGAT